MRYSPSIDIVFFRTDSILLNKFGLHTKVRRNVVNTSVISEKTPLVNEFFCNLAGEKNKNLPPCHL